MWLYLLGPYIHSFVCAKNHAQGMISCNFLHKFDMNSTSKCKFMQSCSFWQVLCHHVYQWSNAHTLVSIISIATKQNSTRSSQCILIKSKRKHNFLFFVSVFACILTHHRDSKG